MRSGRVLVLSASLVWNQKVMKRIVYFLLLFFPTIVWGQQQKLDFILKTLYDGGNQKILDKVFEKIVEIEDLVSINKGNTVTLDVSSVNQSLFVYVDLMIHSDVGNHSVQVKQIYLTKKEI